MVRSAIDDLPLADLHLLVIENVGNLVARPNSGSASTPG